MDERIGSFTFNGYSANFDTGEVVFYYVMNRGKEQWTFREHLAFPAVSDDSLSSFQQNALKNILDNLSLVLGISYWKTYCPRTLTVAHMSLDEPQAEFWNTLFTKGMGEFFYRNSIDYRGFIRFPYTVARNEKPIKLALTGKSLVLLGGGKDSIVTADVLRKHEKKFELLSVGQYPLQRNVAKIMNKKLLIVDRVIDPQLLSLNKTSGVLNGHIPASAVFAFIGLFAACLYGYSYVIASNEESANYGNLEYLGSEINHQWSKTYEFEALFKKYVRTFIVRGIEYFSFLRPIKEIRVVQLFSNLPQYFNTFSSCNANFRLLRNTGGGSWCGMCPKCAFAFLLLAAFLTKKDVLSIFGQNLLNKRSLLIVYKEILGIEGHKPFECVGTPEEALWAFREVITKKAYSNDCIVQMLPNSVKEEIPEFLAKSNLFSVSTRHTIPKNFSDAILSL